MSDVYDPPCDPGPIQYPKPDWRLETPKRKRQFGELIILEGAEQSDGAGGQSRGDFVADAGSDPGADDTWLGVFHRRMKARMGPAAANTATARKLATIL
jgi:hypothetical protein